MKIGALTLVALLMLSGCVSVQKNWLVVDGSRSDATVTTAYEYEWYEKPETVRDQREELASKTCKRWGYEAAESLGTITTECISYDGQGGCNRKRVSVKYQCFSAQ